MPGMEINQQELLVMKVIGGFLSERKEGWNESLAAGIDSGKKWLVKVREIRVH